MGGKAKVKLRGTFLHVSFLDLKPFDRPKQTYNSSLINPSDTRSEKFFFFHNAKQNGQTKPTNLSDEPTMLDGMNRSSRLTF